MRIRARILCLAVSVLPFLAIKKCIKERVPILLFLYLRIGNICILRPNAYQAFDIDFKSLVGKKATDKADFNYYEILSCQWPLIYILV